MAGRVRGGLEECLGVALPWWMLLRFPRHMYGLGGGAPVVDSVENLRL